jgi:hypothetical protein
VERIRKLRFKHIPRVQVLTPREARRYALQDLDRDYPRSRQRSDEEALKALGLIRPRDNMRKIQARIYTREIAGFYDPRAKGLFEVKGGLGGEFGRIVLAHELTHALEDQRIGLGQKGPTTFANDRLTAETALNEGSAQIVMFEDVIRRHHLAVDRRGLARRFRVLGAAEKGGALPRYIEATLVFPYDAGVRFVDEIQRAGGWRAVDELVAAPPPSTEQIIHPRAFRRHERPATVRLEVRPLLDGHWRRVTRAGLGSPRPLARRAATGWAGGLAELWRVGPLPAPDCRAPCRRRDAVVIGWRWDRARDVGQAARAAARWLERGLRARRRGGAWLLRGGAGALAAQGRSLTVALAPTPALARRLAVMAQR